MKCNCNCKKTNKQYIQGSTYTIAWTLWKNSQGQRTKLTDKDIASIEFTIGAIHKYYPQDVKFSEELQSFLVNLTQSDTLAMPSGNALRYARVKWSTGQTKATQPVIDTVIKTNSREVL